MPILVQHESRISGGKEVLNFELAGVLDLKAALAAHGAEAIQQFMRKGHPSAQAYKPGLVLSVAPELKGRGLQHVPVGVFLATREGNPQVSRVLRPRASLDQYRATFSLLIFDARWTSWEEVAAQFRPS